MPTPFLRHCRAGAALVQPLFRPGLKMFASVLQAARSLVHYIFAAGMLVRQQLHIVITA